MAEHEQDFRSFRERGDTAALARVFDALAPELLLVAAHVAPAATDAEDLVQATFLDALAHAARWDAARPLLPWLIGILVNHARALRRERQRPIDAARLPTQTAAPSPLDELAQQEVGERIATAVRGLPRQYRQVLTLRLAHGLQPTAIAHALGCPVATVKTRLQRGLEQLRRVLPASLAASAALVLGTGHGMAQVRTVVLARAAELVPAAAAGAVASWTVLGGLAVKKLAFALALTAAAALAAWVALGPPPDLAPRATERIGPLAPQAAAEPRRTDGAPPPAAEAATRTALAADPAATTGALDLEFVWADDGSPAAHVAVSDQVGDRGAELGRTDADGRLRRADLEPGEHRLFGFSFWHPATVRAGATTTGRVELEGGLRVRGIVVDDAGNAVADAVVEAQDFPSAADREPRAVARSGADGRFACRLDAEHYVWARRGGSASSAAALVAAGDAELRLVLGRGGGGARGSVRTADGAAAAGAELTIVRTANADVCGGPVRLRTAADGTFATDELGPGAHVLVAMAAGHAATAVAFAVPEQEPALLDVHLQQGATLTGTVRRNGAPEPHGGVEVRPDWAGGAQFTEARRPLYLLCALRAATAADGSYALEHAPTGPVTIECSAHDFPDDEVRHLELQDGAAVQVDFALADGGTWRGRALDRDGAPLVGWQIAASPIGGGYELREETDEQGGFALRTAAATRYRVALFPPHDLFTVPWLTRDDAAPDGRELLLRLPCAADGGGTFCIAVLDADGAAAANASATLFRTGSPQGRRCELHRRDDGRFASQRLPPGDYRGGIVRVGSLGGIALPAITVHDHAEVDLGTVRMPASGSLELAFRTADGHTVVPSEVMAFDGAANGGREFEHTADGTLRSASWPAGTYRVRAWGEDLAPFEQQVAIVAGHASRYELAVQAAARVRFVCAPRTPAAGADTPPAGTTERIGLTIATAAGQHVGYRQLELGAVGAACTVGLAPGDYTWELATQTGTPARGTFRVAGTDALEVAIEPPPQR